MAKADAEPAKKNRRLSKSRYMEWLQCPRLMYFSMRLEDQVPPPDRVSLWIMNQGTAAGQAARDSFPGGKLISTRDLDKALEDTAKAIAGGAEFVYEASFQHEGVYCKVDILHSKGRGMVDLYEVKSANSVKEEHLPDIAVQSHIVSGSGLSVDRCFVMHLNRDYVHPGLGELFVSEDCTDLLGPHLACLPGNIAAMKETLASEEPPTREIGPHCSDPRECPLMPLCWRDVPGDSIFQLFGTGTEHARKWDLWRSGVRRVSDLREKDVPSTKRAMFRAFTEKEAAIDPSSIDRQLACIREPVFFMDFETLATPIPLFSGVRPWGQVPFQWSVHRLSGGKLEHFQFLPDDAKDPRRDFAGALLGVLGSEGTVAVYNASMEKTQLAGLAELFPDLAPGIGNVIGRLWDMLPVFRKDYVMPNTGFSASVKDVLPAAFPELSYRDLEIDDGRLAGIEFLRMLSLEPGPERSGIRRSLLEYCKRDTYAMVKLLELLRGAV